MNGIRVIFVIACFFIMSKSIAQHKHMSNLDSIIINYLLEEIFGEFRQDLYNLDLALYNQDYQKAKTLIDGVMKNMFDY